MHIQHKGDINTEFVNYWYQTHYMHIQHKGDIKTEFGCINYWYQYTGSDWKYMDDRTPLAWSLFSYVQANENPLPPPPTGNLWDSDKVLTMPLIIISNNKPKNKPTNKPNNILLISLPISLPISQLISLISLPISLIISLLISLLI